MLAAECSSTRKFRLIYLRAIVPPIQNLQRKNTRIDQPKFLTHFVNKYQKILKHVTTNIITLLASNVFNDLGKRDMFTSSADRESSFLHERKHRPQLYRDGESVYKKFRDKLTG